MPLLRSRSSSSDSDSNSSGGNSDSGGGASNPFEVGGGLNQEQVDNLNKIANQDFVNRDAIREARDRGVNQAPSRGGDQPRPSNADSTPNDISSQLQRAREEALSIQKKVSQLKNKDKSNKPERDIVSSSRDVRQEEKQVDDQIRELEAPSPQTEALEQSTQNYMDLLNQQIEDSQAREEARVDSIRRDSEIAINETKTEQGREAATQRSSLVRSGGYLGESASALGALNNLAKTHRQEISVLQASKQSAITEAREAFSNSQSEIARVRAKQAIDFENTINDRRDTFFTQSLQVMQQKRQQESLELNRESARLSNAITRSQSIAPSILDNLSAIDDPELRDRAIAGYAEKYDIDKNILGSELERRESEEIANQLDLISTRALIRSRDRSNQPSGDGDGSDPEPRLPFDTDTGEFLDYSTEEGVQKGADRGETKASIRVWLDLNRPDMRKSTIDALIKSADFPADRKALEAILNTLTSVAKEQIEKAFDTDTLRRREGDRNILQLRKSELRIAKNDAAEVIENSGYKEKQKRYMLDQIENMEMKDINIDN